MTDRSSALLSDDLAAELRATYSPRAADRERVRGAVLAAVALAPAVAAKAAAATGFGKLATTVVLATTLAGSTAYVVYEARAPERPLVDRRLASPPRGPSAAGPVVEPPAVSVVPAPPPAARGSVPAPSRPALRASAPPPPLVGAPEPQPGAVAPIAPQRLAEEVGLLREAHAALTARAYARALSVLDRHALRFPGGALELERLGLRAVALCELASGEAAAARAAFVTREGAGGSPLGARVERACGGAR